MVARSGGVLRARSLRALRALYPAFVLRPERFSPLSVVSIAYVLSVIATGVYLVVPFTLLPEFAEHPVRSSLLLVAFGWTISACVVSYLLTASADPGRVPDSWRPRPEDFREAVVGENPPARDASSQTSTTTPAPAAPPAPPAVDAAAMLGPDGLPRYCAKCRIFKPDRTHHCSTCGRCVLQMDHHCPFTGNSCIGHSNRKFFVLFLYYASAGCTFVAVFVPPTIYTHLEALGDNVGTSEVVWVIAVIFGYMLCFVHALALSVFAGFHTWLVVKNRTTIENNEARQKLHAEVLRRMDGSAWGHWTAVMGPRPALWFVPVSVGAEGDGVHWRRVDELPRELP